MILTAALGIIDDEGVAALSMRRLASALDRDPMRLYAHAEGKDDLLAGVVAYVLRGFTVAQVEDGNWEGALRETAHRLHRIARAHPNVVPLLLTQGLGLPFVLRPVEALQPIEDLLALFAHAGFDQQGAVHACSVFTIFLQGQMLSGIQQLVDNPEETESVLKYGLHRLPLSRFPRLRALGPALAQHDPDDELNRNLETLLTGLRADLARQSSRTPAASRPVDDSASRAPDQRTHGTPLRAPGLTRGRM